MTERTNNAGIVMGPSDVSAQDLDTTARADTVTHARRGTFLTAAYKAIRAVKRHTTHAADVTENLEDLARTASAIFDLDGAFEVRVSGRRLYLNASRLNLDLENFASFDLVVATLVDAGVGWVRMEEPVSSREWNTLISELVLFGTHESTEEGVEELRRRLSERGAPTLQVGTPAEGETRFADEVEQRKIAKQTYEKSMAVTKNLLEGTRLGQSAHLKEVKRAVRGIVDQVLNNEVASVGLTTLNDFDRYSFAHTVNTCIFSIAIGRRLGMSKNRLFDLGMAALLHDVGKSRIPLDLVKKEGTLTQEEFETVKSHTWLGALQAYQFREYGEIPYRGMITAYEHHMKVDFPGYPATLRPRRLSVFSKIVGLAAAFDAATSTRGYSSAKSPDVVLRELREDPDQGHDRVLVKALITLLGIYPVGTCVILDTHELAIVHASNPDAALVNRPIVRLICDPDGVWLDEPPLVDLAAAGPDGTFFRSIIKVTEPEKYLINVSDYFV